MSKKFEELMLAQFNILNSKFDRLEKRFELIEQRFERFEYQVEARLDKLEIAIKEFDKSFSAGTGHVTRELLYLHENHTDLRRICVEQDGRISANEKQIKLVGACVGYSDDSISAVAKDADNFASIYQKNPRLSCKEREFLLKQRILGKVI